MKSRCKFGLKDVLWFAKNAGIVVFYAPSVVAEELGVLINQMRRLLPADIAKRLVFVVEPVK